jgi:hypothetical protein
MTSSQGFRKPNANTASLCYIGCSCRIKKSNQQEAGNMRVLAIRASAGWMCGLLLLLFFVGSVQAQPAGWKPDRVIEIIVGTAPGAAPDKTARLIQRLWQTRGLYDGPVTVVNKPGGRQPDCLELSQPARRQRALPDDR